MALGRRNASIAFFILFVAWLSLITWAPIFRYLVYAFLTGAVAASVVVIAFISLSFNPKSNDHVRPTFSSSNTILVTPQAWTEETAYLSEAALYKQDTIYPPSFVTSQAIDSLLDWVLRDFVTSWYNHISKSPAFVNEIDRSARAAIIEIQRRVFDRDVVEIAVSRVVPLVTKHLRDFYEAEKAVRGINLSRNVTESEELDLAIAGKYRDGHLHVAASLKHSDLKTVQQEHLRRIVARVLPEVLPENMIKSRAVSVLIKEIMSCAVLAPLMQMLSDPDTWNQIMEAYGRTMMQDRRSVRKLRAALDEHASPPPKPLKPQSLPRLLPGDDERKFERFVRSIRQCNNLSEARRLRSEVASKLKREALMDCQDQIYLRRLETGKQLLDQRVGKLSAVGNSSEARVHHAGAKDEKITAAALTGSLREVLYSAAGLSYFMEFMDRRKCMVLVQFWIVVDGIRNPLEDESQTEDPFAPSQKQWIGSDRMDLAQINEAYLSRSELRIPDETKRAVTAFLQANSKATGSQFVQARSAVLKAQSKIYAEMDEAHFSEFKQSDLFYKYLTADDSASKGPIKPPTRAIKEPSVPSIPESPSRPPVNRLTSKLSGVSSKLRRNAASSSDLSNAAKVSDAAFGTRRSLDVNTSGPLFDDDVDDERLARSTHSLDSESINGDQGTENQDQMVNAMEAALTDILTDDNNGEDSREPLFERSESGFLGDKFFNAPRNPAEPRSVENSVLSEKDRERPNLASLGLVNTSSRIGVFTDNDLFGDEEKFLEDEQTDPELSAEEKSVDDGVEEAKPGDLGLAEAITALTADIDRLAAQESVLETLSRKAELTNNVAELRILGKSRSSLQREIRRKEMQRQQYIVQESDNSLFGRANVKIKSIVVGREDDGQEFALYLIEVQRQAGENMPAASWAVPKRYSEFHDLHRRLRQKYPAVRNIEFPRRRLVMKLQQEFLRKRKAALEMYLRQLLRLPAVCRSRDLRAFLSQSAIVSQKDSTQDGERQDIVSRLYNSVADGMDEFMGNVPVLDQLSLAGQNLISAATSQFNTITTSNVPNPSTNAATSLPIAPEDPIQTTEARAELLAFESDVSNPARSDQLEPFVKPISDLFLEAFDLQRGNNWLRGRAVVVVLHQLLGGTVERKVREIARTLFAETAVLKYIDMLKATIWPDGHFRKEKPVRSPAEKGRTKTEMRAILTTLLPELAGNVVGKQNAQAASRRLTATINNERLNTHLAFVILDVLVEEFFPRPGVLRR
ncbi:uncharacterized protein KY384_002140 [Bacidia gigantensis]|uniref:uncharacterized protein n=1 Tax=Bacidia gigantensis TaxID=2732470 RepID=UPI001D036197|nr:uncharacterized protein KY384_002140 [Bacidia gigantensis]KAG8533357.1 hypothetical protein KY384_002140 [Bacidia gigantensis]